MVVTLNINGKSYQVDVPPDMPLLWAVRDVVGLTGTKRSKLLTMFGCGIAQCGACTVHLDGQPIRSCVTPVSAVGGKPITTIEAVGDIDAAMAGNICRCGTYPRIRAAIKQAARTASTSGKGA